MAEVSFPYPHETDLDIFRESLSAPAYYWDDKEALLRLPFVYPSRRSPSQIRCRTCVVVSQLTLPEKLVVKREVGVSVRH